MALALFQPLCVLVLALALSAMRGTSSTRELLARYTALALAAWLGELSCIRLYGFYAYAPSWTGFIDVVPVLVPLIWPLVVLSALAVTRALGVPPRWRPLAVLIQVVVDASLVEIIAVRAGYWHWTEPGYLDVPLVGIVGWGWFAAGAAFAIERSPARFRIVDAARTIASALVATHLGLLATWWLLLRHVLRGPFGTEASIAVAAWSALAIVLLRRRAGSVPLSVMRPRMVAAALFVAVLASLRPVSTALVVHTIAVAVPYLVLTRFAPSAERVDVGGEARA